jgi:glycosyltransferase involved in cell wall biosynthesis
MRTDVICFGGEDWWYKNRGHNDMQLMRQYSKSNKVLYINSIVMQKPRLSEGRKFLQKLIRKAKSIFSGLKRVDTGFWVYSPFSLPMHHIRWASAVNEKILVAQVSLVRRRICMPDPIFWVACPAACEIAIRMKRNKLVYQRTDRYEEYPNVDRDIIVRYDQKLKKAADLTLFANRTLFEEERSQCRQAIFLDHGVDYETFVNAEKDICVPEDIAGIPGPRIGFFGAIDDHTFDVAFTEKLVECLPQMSFVFVGQPSADVSNLKEKKNVWFLGRKPYEQIPHYGKLFDITIMPWRQNKWIEACNPIKLKEYLALGKPVVSTPFTELRQYSDIVYEARTPFEFAECIKRALTEDGPEKKVARRARVANATWEHKAKMVLKELFGQ